ncbi:zf-UBP-domain-containing protein [Trametes versicolor FP-101664 SS1]|uniref:zf-UBP-domain-containing protein n=1 Tax=Trametes versicolor (strain FP-101664) TaxID=717944 RepID=UPI0004623B64|nr:zf-UBP-domain-containing protein [Trametes versicolor FP-101664 SS1]EIW58742.1 zf-UBP-domain-containing protein [Trametes versicolor FP-101664 SS1]
MRGYHIRISLVAASASASSSTATSGSYKQASAIASAASGSRSDTFVPRYLFQQLPSHNPKSSARRNTLSVHSTGAHPHVQSQKRTDYRHGPIRVDWVDFSHMDEAGGFKKVSAGKERETSATATFVPHSKSGSANLPEGVVHIFRDYPHASPADGHTSGPRDASAAAASVPDGETEGTSMKNIEADDVTLAVLAVPSWMTPSDFLAFVAPAADGIAHLRMIRRADSAPNRSVVVMKFRDPANAAEFVEAYNGKPFNSMEPEACHVVRVLSIAIDSDDPISESITRIGSARVSGAYELPTCPVCLERMDAAVTGLVTVPCSHTFHCACLSKWGDSRCPVCRYSQTLLSSHPSSPNTSRTPRAVPFAPSASPNERSHCADCASTTNLWICLICGNIGCGRYGRAHAHAHYAATTHLYALELETQRVWDYAGDGYVHRLIQNKADGKLVELPSAAAGVGARSDGGVGGGGPTAADALTAEKIEAIGIEYSYLLTSQLDSQRTFYEEQTAELRGQVESMRSLVEQLGAEVELHKQRAHQEAERRAQDEAARVAELEREKIKAEKRAEKATELARTLAKELREERAVSEGLMKNLAVAKENTDAASRETDNLRTQVQELQDQVRDVMFFLEAKNKIESGEGVAAEAAGGSLEITEQPDTRRSGGKKRNKH